MYRIKFTFFTSFSGGGVFKSKQLLFNYSCSLTKILVVLSLNQWPEINSGWLTDRQTGEIKDQGIINGEEIQSCTGTHSHSSTHNHTTTTTIRIDLNPRTFIICITPQFFILGELLILFCLYGLLNCYLSSTRTVSHLSWSSSSSSSTSSVFSSDFSVCLLLKGRERFLNLWFFF